MYKELKEKVCKLLVEETDKIYNSDTDIVEKLEKQNDVLNLIKVLEHYEELEPMMAKYFNEKARKEKFEGER